MKKFLLAAAAMSALCAYAQGDDIVVATEAYQWKGDSIIQDEFKAWAVSPYEIRSTYSGRPHYKMPIDKVWKLKNDISAYPRLETSNKLLEAVYNLGLDEMVNAVEPDTTLRTGKEWAGVWTRDVSYSIILSMASLQPEASKISLMKKVNAEGQIIQDTGSGGAWPISTDRMVWVLAAWEIYKASGDKDWLKQVYPIAKRSIEKDVKNVLSDNHLVKGETSFIDWREQSYPKWMQTVDISQSEAMNTNVVFAAALKVLSEMAYTLGHKEEGAQFAKDSKDLTETINEYFWMPDKGYYAMYSYGRQYPILNPRAETLGESLAVIYDIASEPMQRSIVENNPVTPFGAAIFFPQISDMPNYHNNALWPFVGSYWALANAKAGNEEGTLEAIGAIIRPAALFTTNKENFNLDNGDIYTELNSSNMLWSLAGNLALTNHILMGINFEPDGIRFAPFVPENLADMRTLSNFPYRDSRLNITVEGYGSGIKEMTFNGKPVKSDGFLSAKQLAKGGDIRIVLDGNFTPMKVNRQPNLKAPLTPIARLEPSLDGIGTTLSWNPIEYIAGYVVIRNGQPIKETRQTSYRITEPGEYMVIGIDEAGTPGFASEPLSVNPWIFVNMDGEGHAMTSLEVSYQPTAPIEGYEFGFVETDHERRSIETVIDVPEKGYYTIYTRYANGNGPVNTENKAAVRTLIVNDLKAGTVVMPHRGRGNWDDWGLSNGVQVWLPEGKSAIKLDFLPENENMNLSTNHALVDGFMVIRK